AGDCVFVFLHQAVHALVASGAWVSARRRSSRRVDRSPRYSRRRQPAAQRSGEILRRRLRRTLRLPGLRIRCGLRSVLSSATLRHPTFASARATDACVHAPAADRRHCGISAGTRGHHWGVYGGAAACVRAFACLRRRSVETERRFLYHERSDCCSPVPLRRRRFAMAEPSPLIMWILFCWHPPWRMLHL